jgi:hypothetical protein
MPAGVALLPIYRALRALLVADGALTGLLAAVPGGFGSGPGIYADGAVPQGAAFPYLTMGAGTQNPQHTMGDASTAHWGWNCTVQIKAVGQGQGEDQGLAVMDAVGKVLYEGRTLTVTGYANAYCDEWVMQPTLIDTVAGVTTREWPAIVRVVVHD